MKFYWLYGKHSVKEALKNPKRCYEKILVTKETLTEIADLNLNKNKIYIVDKKDIDRLFTAMEFKPLHQNIAVYIQKLEQPSLWTCFDKNGIIVLLDQLYDSHNIGAIIRSAYAFNINTIISTINSSPDENANMLKSASGCFEKVAFIQVVNLHQTIKELQKNGYWIFGLDGNATHTINKIDTGIPKIALVLGNEEHGLRRLIRESCDMLVKIPIKTDLESLNVSNAAAIAFYSFVK
jgi:23S rRNA (guanosine2251-2'-O)-methyltransferase